MDFDSPFHEGELSVQLRAREVEYARRNAGLISNTIPIGAIPFISQQSLVVFGSVDPDDNLWASVMVGDPGFIKAQDERTVLLDTQQQLSAWDEPFWTNIKSDTDVGLLVIALATRQRLRINGQIKRLDKSLFKLTVAQAYSNCPKYIQQRQLTLHAATEPSQSITSRLGTPLGDEQITLITNADTFFVASANPGHGVDASHRGGNPGFVHILNQQRIRIPDYNGNSLFNTLGNLTAYPHAGLVFLDFETNRVLQLTGNAKILWDHDDSTNPTGGTGRYWELEIKQWCETSLPRKLSWTLPDYSPYNPIPQQSTPSDPTMLKLRITRIRQKTQRIKSFQLTAVNNATLPEFEAGAHLPIQVTLPNGRQAYRQYSILSDSADRTHYEIAVLVEPDGRGGSRFMHENVNVNQLIETGVPRNDFPLSRSGNHHILIAGGIGITAILSMLKSLAENGTSLEVHYAVRTELDFSYRDEIELLSAGHAFFYHSDGLNAKKLNIDQLLSEQKQDTHVYVCGPVRMIESVRRLADQYSWNPDQIHFETFGSHSTSDDKTITIHLSRSKKTIAVKSSQTILDALSDVGITVPHDCKRGECGMCATGVIEGEPDHRDLYLSSSERQHIMCPCVSRAKSDELVLDL